MSTECRSPEQCLEEGKKFLAAGYPAQAVESLQDACSLLAEDHGQTAPELAEPYYLYGKALLELARSQSTVLGSGIPVPNESSDSSDDEGDNEDAPDTVGTNEATSTGPSTADEGEAPGPSTANEGDAPGPSTANEGEAPGPSTANEGEAPGPSTANEAPGPSTANEGEAPGSSDINEGEEDESDLKLAWEILELARVICQKQNGEENKLKLSDVQMVLAEVSLESDQSDEAIADLNSCLQIRELFLEPHDRRLAEVHFNLGLAHTMSQQPEPAISHFTSAKAVLIKRIQLLDAEMGGVNEERKTAIMEEMSDITALLPDMEVKICDTQEMKRMMDERENQTLGVEESGFPPVSSATNDKSCSKPATDISHLVRKRVVTESSGDESSAAKKPHTQENGQASTEQ